MTLQKVCFITDQCCCKSEFHDDFQLEPPILILKQNLSNGLGANATMIQVDRNYFYIRRFLYLVKNIKEVRWGNIRKKSGEKYTDSNFKKSFFEMDLVHFHILDWPLWLFSAKQNL
jgi:hypothetical protein